jgi:5'-deoxynucleotidase YfbR-like HD superfamily hydrolase
MIFGELDARLSMVQRWVVVNTIKKQSVAEHCFNVERIASRMARGWFGIHNMEDLYKLSQIALHHDDDEAIYGDVPSPVKHILSETYLDGQRRLWYNDTGPLAQIVKLADKMEAYQFLTMEYELGNRYISAYRLEIREKVLAAADKLYQRDAAETWLDQIDKIKGTTHDPTTGSPESSAESREG